MTDTDDDLRAAREWLQNHTGDFYGRDAARHTATILRLLDRPVMPRPEELNDDDIKAAMARWEKHNDGGFTRTVYRALWDRYNPPPSKQKVEAWAVVFPDGTSAAYTDEGCARFASGSTGRIIKLVEADDADE